MNFAALHVDPTKMHANHVGRGRGWKIWAAQGFDDDDIYIHEEQLVTMMAWCMWEVWFGICQQPSCADSQGSMENKASNKAGIVTMLMAIKQAKEMGLTTLLVGDWTATVSWAKDATIALWGLEDVVEEIQYLKNSILLSFHHVLGEENEVSPLQNKELFGCYPGQSLP